jgi:Uma2 family endonuclease
VRVERINGERFTAVEPTPLLSALIAEAREALAAGVAPVLPGATVAAGRTWVFGPGTELVPSIVVAARGEPSNGAPPVPDLVVEFRTESTGRYVLGPKRMVYSRFRVAEFWYVDPLRRRVAVLRSEGGEEYSWPPSEHGVDDVLRPSRLPGVSVPVRALVGEAFERDPRAGGPAGEEWLES